METNQLVLQMLGGLFNFEIVLRDLKKCTWKHEFVYILRILYLNWNLIL